MRGCYQFPFLFLHYMPYIGRAFWWFTRNNVFIKFDLKWPGCLEEREYHKLFEVADISVYIPLLCFSYYIAVNLRKYNLLLFLLGNLQLGWLQIVAFVLGLILFIEGKVNEKVRYAKHLLVTWIFPYFGYRVLWKFSVSFGCQVPSVSSGISRTCLCVLRCDWISLFWTYNFQ